MQKEHIINPFSTALKSIRQSPVQYIRFNILFFAIIFLINYLAAILSMKITYDRYLQEIILVVIKIPVTAYFIGGFLYFYISIVRGVTGRAAQIYRGYRWYPAILAYELIVYFSYILMVRPSSDFLDYPFPVQFRILLVALAFVYFFVRASLFLAILVDTRVPFWKAMAESFALTAGNFLETGLFIALGFTIILSGLLAAGIGIIFTMAVAALGYVLGYDMMRKKKAPGNQPVP